MNAVKMAGLFGGSLLSLVKATANTWKIWSNSWDKKIIKAIFYSLWQYFSFVNGNFCNLLFKLNEDQ